MSCSITSGLSTTKDYSMEPISCIPSDPKFWLERPLGYWERQMIVEWPPVTEGPRRCTCNNVTHIKTETEIDLNLFEAAVRVTVHNEPHLRADVDLNAVPERWTIATDFTDLFRSFIYYEHI